MTTPPTLTGERVVLRPHRPSDVPRIVAACSDEQTSYWLGMLPTPYDDEHARAYLESNAAQEAAGDAVHWAVADPGTDALLGSVSLMDLTSGSGPEVGYWAHPDARGHGTIADAVRRIVEHAFTPKADGGAGFGKLRLESAWDNAASRRVAERCGFREVGLERHAIICRDGLHDAVKYVRLVTDLS
ncbi:MAG: GNAT family N-acetyltransferase [Propionibacteriales bacterium]|nr:GNAT family N-acetyltransferase [Propionibacteriales bacterium]